MGFGVDIPRLGLMVVNGQPKSMAEYIQATSRVGRTFPGLVCTIYNWARPRDLSHYGTFEHYHQAFYNRGLAYERKGVLDSAAMDFQQTLRIKPDYDPAALGLQRLQAKGLRIFTPK